MTNIESYRNAVFLTKFAPAVLMIDRYVSLIWFSLGFFGNILSFVVWMTPKIRQQNSSAIYLAAMSFGDFLLLLFMVIRDLEYAWNKVVLSSNTLCKTFQVVYMTCQYLSPLLVLAFTIERWIAVCYPFKRERICTPRHATIVVVFLSFLCLSVCCIQGYFWSFSEKKEQCEVNDITSSSQLWRWYTWIIEFLISAVVPVLALIFNLLVIQEMYRIHRRSYHSADRMFPEMEEASRNFRSTTFMLVSVSFFLIFTTLPAGLVYALQGFAHHGEQNLSDEGVRQDPMWQRYFTMITIKAVIDELALSHFAVNFIIYFVTGRVYRQQVQLLFSCKSDNQIRHPDDGHNREQRYNSLKSKDGTSKTNELQGNIPLADVPSPHLQNGSAFPRKNEKSARMTYI